MDKVPHFAIINEAVNLTKEFKLKKFSSFCKWKFEKFLRNKDEFSKIEAINLARRISIENTQQILI